MLAVLVEFYFVQCTAFLSIDTVMVMYFDSEIITYHEESCHLYILEIKITVELSKLVTQLTFLRLKKVKNS